MSSVIKIKRSDTQGSVPSGLQVGEIAVNLFDRKLYVGNTASGVSTIGGEDFRLTTQDSGSEGAYLRLLGDSILSTNNVLLSAGEGIDISRLANGTITFAGEDASTSNKGIASFNTTSFTVSSGAVSAKDLTLNGDSGSAAATIGESMTIAGTANEIETSATGTTVTIGLPNDVTIGQDLTVTRNTDIQGTLNADGATTLNGVTATTIGANGNVTVGGTLGVTGATTLSSTLGVTGATTLSSTLAVTGAATITGQANLNGGINADSGAFTVADTSGNIHTSGTLNVDGSTTLNDVTAVDVSANGNLTVTGTSTLTGNVTAQGDLTVNGDTTIDGNLTVEGALTYISTSTVYADDGMFKLSANNAGDSVDTGIYALYVDGATNKYAGYFRDATDGVFKFYKESQTEPTTTVDTAATGYALAQVDAVIDGGTY